MKLILALVRLAFKLASLVSPRLTGGLAFALFSRPSGRARVRPVERHIHVQASTETLALDGQSVVVYRWGDGRHPVLMLHGWEGRASRYAGLVRELLDRGLSPMAFDSLGHGDSGGKSTDIREYAEIIHLIHERQGPFHAIVAHSFGVLCVFHALRTGVKTGRVVAISGVCDFRYLADKFCTVIGLSDRVQADVRQRVEDYFAPEIDIWQKFSVTHEPSTIQTPILVIHDDDDETVDPEQARRIVAAYGQRARLVTTHGLGHRRILTSPLVIKHVADFLVDTEPPPVVPEPESTDKDVP